MARFDIGDIAIYVGSGFNRHLGVVTKSQSVPGCECNVVSHRKVGEVRYQDGTRSGFDEAWYWCIFIGDPSPSGPGGAWAVTERNLRQTQPPKESTDIQKTRKLGAPSWDACPWQPGRVSN